MSNDAIDDLNEQEQIRREKLARIQSQGIDPFPVGFKPDHTLLEVRNENKDLAPEAKTGKKSKWTNTENRKENVIDLFS